MLLIDIDHLIPTGTIQSIFGTELSSTNFHTFGRINYDGSDYKDHPDSYLMTKDLYWLIGGQDETFAGHYGTDLMYRRRAEKYAGRIHHADWKLVRVDREDIPDASTRTLNRKEGRDISFRRTIREYKRREGINEVQILRLPWERLIPIPIRSERSYGHRQKLRLRLAQRKARILHWVKSLAVPIR